MVSTDSAEIGDVAVSFGAEVPFARPEVLSGDECGTFPVLQHALEFLLQQPGIPIDSACCIYPTAVLLSAYHVRESLRRLVATAACSYCFSVCVYEHPIQRALRIEDSGRIAALSPEYYGARTQDLPLRYYDAGQFYWGRATAIRAGVPIFSSASLPYVLGRNEFVDVDDLDDWERAEALAKVLRQSKETERPFNA